jgi:acylphosphatase
MSVCMRCQVKGRVQGVWYRQSTLRMAEAYGVTGWVRNLSNGDVELLVCGAEGDVEKLKKWLWQGPVNAEVSDVKCEVVENEAHSGFVVQP